MGDAEYESERTASRTEAAAVLNAVADGVLTGAVRLGDDESAVAVDVPESVALEVEVEREGDAMSLEVELEWLTHEDASGVSPLDTHSQAGPGGTAGGDDSPPAEPTGAPADAEAEGGAEPASADAGEGVEPGALDASDEPPMPVGAVEPVESLANFEVFEDRAGEWRWRLRHRNGNVIADSGEGYTRKHNALNGLQSVMQNAPGASVTEDGDADEADNES